MPDKQSLIESLRTTAETEQRIGLLQAYANERNVPDKSGTYDYERDASDLAAAVPGLVQLAEGVVRGGTGDPALRFLCASIAFNGLRRQDHFGRARAILDQVAAEFGDVPLFLHYQAAAMAGGSIADMRQGLEWATKAHALLPDNAGVAHTCAVLIADLASNDAFENPKDELGRGIDLVNEAITGYGKRARFYHTRARLRRLHQDYDRARIDIAQAIDLEDAEGIDSSKRIAIYLIERSMIDADRSIARLATKAQESNDRLTTATEKLQRSIDSSQIQLIEVIAFVTAILGLVMATMGEIRNQSPQDALTVLAGVAVLLFGAVLLGSWLLRRKMSR